MTGNLIDIRVIPRNANSTLASWASQGKFS